MHNSSDYTMSQHGSQLFPTDPNYIDEQYNSVDSSIPNSQMYSSHPPSSANLTPASKHPSHNAPTAHPMPQHMYEHLHSRGTTPSPSLHPSNLYGSPLPGLTHSMSRARSQCHNRTASRASSTSRASSAGSRTNYSETTPMPLLKEVLTQLQGIRETMGRLGCLESSKGEALWILQSWAASQKLPVITKDSETLAQLKSKYLKVRFWEESDYRKHTENNNSGGNSTKQLSKRGKHNQKNDINTAAPFLEDKDGSIVGGTELQDIRNTIYSILQDLADAGRLRKSWQSCGLETKEAFYFQLEYRHPVFSLCANHWKAKAFLGLYFRGWLKKTMYGKGSEAGAVEDGSSTDSDDSDTNITELGSKRKASRPDKLAKAKKNKVSSKMEILDTAHLLRMPLESGDVAAHSAKSPTLSPTTSAPSTPAAAVSSVLTTSAPNTLATAVNTVPTTSAPNTSAAAENSVPTTSAPGGSVAAVNEASADAPSTAETLSPSSPLASTPAPVNTGSASLSTLSTTEITPTAAASSVPTMPSAQVSLREAETPDTGPPNQDFDLFAGITQPASTSSTSSIPPALPVSTTDAVAKPAASSSSSTNGPVKKATAGKSYAPRNDMFTARNLYAHVWVANFGGTKSEFDQHWKTVSQGGGSSTGCLYSANAKGYKLLEIALVITFFLLSSLHRSHPALLRKQLSHPVSPRQRRYSVVFLSS
jgi:hypothetical protein